MPSLRQEPNVYRTDGSKQILSSFRRDMIYPRLAPLHAK